MDKFVVSHAPFVRSSNDINKMFVYTSVILLLPLIFGCFFFGFNALFIALVSVVVCWLSESLFNLLTIKKFNVTDLSFFLLRVDFGVNYAHKNACIYCCNKRFFI